MCCVLFSLSQHPLDHNNHAILIPHFREENFEAQELEQLILGPKARKQ